MSIAGCVANNEQGDVKPVMTQVFTRKVVLPGDKMDGYLEAIGDREAEFTSLRADS